MSKDVPVRGLKGFPDKGNNKHLRYYAAVHRVLEGSGISTPASPVSGRERKNSKKKIAMQGERRGGLHGPIIETNFKAVRVCIDLIWALLRGNFAVTGQWPRPTGDGTPRLQHPSSPP